jgi:hypothetical protein
MLAFSDLSIGRRSRIAPFRYHVYSDSCDYAELIGLQKYSAKSVSMALQSSGGKCFSLGPDCRLPPIAISD